MKLYLRYSEDVMEVRLSERNLLSLLSKLYTDGSARTLETTDVVDPETDVLTDGLVLRVIAESDEMHYGERAFAPGTMHPDTEYIVGLIREWRQLQDLRKQDGTNTSDQ